ncbi:TIP41-like protein [Heptranchias perlo]|uniref:TIP41-like protein n=1 Tax=Heptranchias perlo TaxID=212740 RepID=UPI00355941BC
MTTHSFKNSKQEFNFGPWKLTANKSHIMKSKDIEKLAEEMKMHSLPEMLFGDNVLKVQHAGGFGITFNATDALRRVDNGHGTVKVACAEAWQESRADSEHSKEVVKPYDWTFTTDYKGTLLGDDLKLKVTPTTERIDLEKLKTREQIMYFEEVLLFEDELHDHGVSMLSVKVRVMPSSFFVLLRFFLRVDGVLIRTNDTRVYHEADKNYLLSEYSSRESNVSALQTVPQYLFTDPNEISQYLPLKQLICEKLEFPEGVDNNTVFGNMQICVTAGVAGRESRQT